MFLKIKHNIITLMIRQSCLLLRQKLHFRLIKKKKLKVSEVRQVGTL